jgi:pyruvate,water dikinase
VTPLVVALSEVAACREELVGGKAAKLSRLAGSGCRVPAGFCLTVAAYETFVQEHDIEEAIRMELGRKDLDGMRWEEIWDAALRIRSLFLARPLPWRLQEALREAVASLGATDSLAVRSSALGEDSGDMSFAGIHESSTDVRTESDVETAVRLVWASLWSDAALLYRRELRLDPAVSRMAVLVQRMVHADRSGVAFGVDPRGANENLAIVEAVPGPCRLLVDGAADPDRWEIRRDTGEVVAWRPGERDDDPAVRKPRPLLEREELNAVLDAIRKIEDLFRWAPDVEWTGRSESLTILQARPITTGKPDADSERRRSLSLRPGDARLRELRARVADELIPRLEAEGKKLSEESLEEYDDARLADALEHRGGVLVKWKKIYWDVFIPFAHGVRRLATYYNDFVQPSDPYEFVGLLQKQPLMAAERNDAIEQLAARVAGNEPLRRGLEAAADRIGRESSRSALRHELADVPGGEGFLLEFEELSRRFLDIAYEGRRLGEAPEPVLRNILELSRDGRATGPSNVRRTSAELLEKRLLSAVGDERREQALEMVAIGRVSWKLRDDDNLLVSRIESQLLRAFELALRRLRDADRVVGDPSPGIDRVPAVVRALRDPTGNPVEIASRAKIAGAGSPLVASGEKPRQLIGQPASPGLASGVVRVLRGRADLGKFRNGEVLVCDAIQPTMTHLAMLAAAVVERRGGMLIHGAIIARELGIPCVNGVRDAAQQLRDGDLVTVDGHLGIVTVGPPELDLELRSPRGTRGTPDESGTIES